MKKPFKNIFILTQKTQISYAYQNKKFDTLFQKALMFEACILPLYIGILKDVKQTRTHVVARETNFFAKRFILDVFLTRLYYPFMLAKPDYNSASVCWDLCIELIYFQTNYNKLTSRRV